MHGMSQQQPLKDIVNTDGTISKISYLMVTDENGRPVKLLTEETGQRLVKLLERMVQLQAKLVGELP